MQRGLERRLKYFFSSPRRGRRSVDTTISRLKNMGPVAVIGGMIRDIALFGNRCFFSDIDLVVQPGSLTQFESEMELLGGRRNRFGGFALPASKWRIDVWALENTWAKKAGHIEVGTFGDLKKATFFNCDAIVYELSSKQLICEPSYFENLEKRELEINLRPTPNELGNAVRAVRYSLLKGFVWGPEVSSFFSDAIERHGWLAMTNYESRSFGTAHIQQLYREQLSQGLSDFLSDRGSQTFDPSVYKRYMQLPLPIGNSLH